MVGRQAIRPVRADEVDEHGQVAEDSGWHIAEQCVAMLSFRARWGERRPAGQASWAGLLDRLGAGADLARRDTAARQRSLEAANRVIEALNALPDDASLAELERALGLPRPAVVHDHIGAAMQRVLQRLQRDGLLLDRAPVVNQPSPAIGP